MANLSRTIVTAYSAGNLGDNDNFAPSGTGRAANAAWYAQVSAADVVIDNSAGTMEGIDIELELGSVSWTVNDVLRLYQVPSLDGGTDYAYSTGTIPPPDYDYLLTTFSPSRIAESGARRLIKTAERKLIVGHIKFIWQWSPGTGSAALATSGNLASYRTWRWTST